MARLPFGMVLRLSLADLKHEWILSFCLVMAVAAVLSPLLILFGLKFGTIEVLRYRLVQDPRNREIRPMVSTSFEPAWFDEMRARPEVAFIVPTTRQISATVDARVKGVDGDKVALDLIPTDEGDRLVLENRAAIPSDMGCVLSSTAAAALGAKAGDTLVLTAKRIKGTAYETADLPLTVEGVLDARATALNQVFVRLSVLEAVERYKDGQSVPEYGWPGTTPKAYPVFDGLLVVLDAPLDPVAEFQLVNNSGFSEINQVDAAKAAQLAGAALPQGKTVYFLSTRTKPVDEDSLATIGYRLRGKNAALIPWVEPVKAQLLDESGAVLAEFRVGSLGLTGLLAAGADLSGLAAWDAQEVEQDDGTGGDTAAWRILLPPDSVDAPSGPARLKLVRGEDVLEFPVQLVSPGFGQASPDQAAPEAAPDPANPNQDAPAQGEETSAIQYSGSLLGQAEPLVESPAEEPADTAIDQATGTAETGTQVSEAGAQVSEGGMDSVTEEAKAPAQDPTATEEAPTEEAATEEVPADKAASDQAASDQAAETGQGTTTDQGATPDQAAVSDDQTGTQAPEASAADAAPTAQVTGSQDATPDGQDTADNATPDQPAAPTQEADPDQAASVVIAPRPNGLVPPRLAGIMNLFGQRNLDFDPTLGDFVLGRRGYAGFRLYAATIEDVAVLKDELEASGIPVHTEAARIRDVLELDRYLTLIFLLIAVVALVGGAASLMSSLYASVERKRRDLSVLRLLGLSGGRLWLFPIYQGVVIAGLGFGVAWGFFEIMAKIINTLFAAHLQAEESLCRLAWHHVAEGAGGTIAIAILVGLVAAWRVTSIDPAEALRDE